MAGAALGGAGHLLGAIIGSILALFNYKMNGNIPK